MTYWEMFSDPWATIDEQINRAQAAAGDVADVAWSYSPMGMAQSAYQNAPTSESMLQTLDDWTYTPWEMAHDISEKALQVADPRNYLPEINWTRVAIVLGVIAISGGAFYLATRR
jgi:hypothetical protein